MFKSYIIKNMGRGKSGANVLYGRTRSRARDLSGLINTPFTVKKTGDTLLLYHQPQLVVYQNREVTLKPDEAKILMQIQKSAHSADLIKHLWKISVGNASANDLLRLNTLVESLRAKMEVLAPGQGLVHEEHLNGFSGRWVFEPPVSD